MESSFPAQFQWGSFLLSLLFSTLTGVALQGSQHDPNPTLVLHLLVHSHDVNKPAPCFHHCRVAPHAFTAMIDWPLWNNVSNLRTLRLSCPLCCRGDKRSNKYTPLHLFSVIGRPTWHDFPEEQSGRRSPVSSASLDHLPQPSQSKTVFPQCLEPSQGLDRIHCHALSTVFFFLNQVLPVKSNHHR